MLRVPDPAATEPHVPTPDRRLTDRPVTDRPETGPSGELTIRTIAMPRDANANGDIFGGWVASQMDLAGGICAGERSLGRVATVAIDAMSFVRPVGVCDVLCVYTDVAQVGRTSVRVGIQAWARRRADHTVRELVTSGTFTYVAIDDQGTPRPVPGATDTG